MRRLLILRHAKSDRLQTGKGDHERVLNARGQKDATLIGAYLAHHDFIPDQAVVSTADRTRETWTLVANALPDIPVGFESRLYAAEASTILQVVMETEPDVKTLIIVGHNPGFHDIALTLVGSGDIETRQRLQEKFPTAGLAVIEFAVENWRKLRLASGRLERFVSPRVLAAAVD